MSQYTTLKLSVFSYYGIFLNYSKLENQRIITYEKQTGMILNSGNFIHWRRERQLFAAIMRDQK